MRGENPARFIVLITYTVLALMVGAFAASNLHI